MKTYLVKKYPKEKVLAECTEVPQDYNGEIPEGSELMSSEQFDAWKSLPEQQEFIQNSELVTQSEYETKIQTERQAKIDEYIAVWDCTEAQAIYELKRTGDII